MVFHVDEVVEIPSDDEVDIAAEPPVSPWELTVVSQELVASL